MKIKTGFIFFILLLFAATTGYAQDPAGLSKGQTVYVPAYSHIYIGNKETPYLLTVTLSIRNTDLSRKITITTADYYETQGKFLKPLIKAPVELEPLASTRYVIQQKDKEGGSGANFIVRWTADHYCNPPVIEAVMIGTQSQQGISFTSRGVPITEHKEK